MSTQRAFASGRWHVQAGSEDAFVKNWNDLLTWTRETQSHLVSATLMRAESDPQLFISFAEWDDTDARTAWKQAPEFANGHQACRALCDEFHGGDYDTTVTI